MRTETLTTEIKIVGYDELSADDRALIDRAKEMTSAAYAPYSRFRVGAAIRMGNGIIVGGSNQENAAFSSGTCAERTACFQASALHPGEPMRKIAVAAWTKGEFQGKPISPCGACRQALLEYEVKHGPIEVLLYGKEEIYVLPSVASLLPLCFTHF